jgi:hypothetical protein
VVGVPFLFPDITPLFRTLPVYPDAFVAIALTATCFFAGHTLQAVASILEPLLFWSWGGNPALRALDQGLGERYLPKELGNKIRHRLQTAAGQKLSSKSLFFTAMQTADSGNLGRVGRFNAMYAYQRVFAVLAAFAPILYAASFAGGLALRLDRRQNTMILLCLALVALLFWHRAKQRSFYYVREVLLQAEYILANPECHSAASKKKGDPDGNE